MIIWLVSDTANVHETHGVWVRLIFSEFFLLLLDISQDIGGGFFDLLAAVI